MKRYVSMGVKVGAIVAFLSCSVASGQNVPRSTQSLDVEMEGKELVAVGQSKRSQVLSSLEGRKGVSYLKGEENGSPHVVFVVGEPEYRAERTMPLLASILHRNFGFHVTLVWPVNDKGEIQMEKADVGTELDFLEHVDCVVFATRWHVWSDENKKHFESYLKLGKGVVGFRCANHGWKEWEGWEPREKLISRLWGHRFFGHHVHRKGDLARFDVNEDVVAHPVLKGVKGPIPSKASLYVLADEDGQKGPLYTTLLNGVVTLPAKPKKKHKFAPGDLPVVSAGALAHEYTHPEGGDATRVFYSSIAHPVDFHQEMVRRIGVQAILWASGQEKLITEEGVNVALPYQYDPADQGDIRRGGAKKHVEWLKGKRPAEVFGLLGYPKM